MPINPAIPIKTAAMVVARVKIGSCVFMAGPSVVVVTQRTVCSFRAKDTEPRWRPPQVRLEEGTAAIPWSQGKVFLFTVIRNCTPDSLEALDLSQDQAIKI
jgi:hypothetical protein